MKWGRSGRVDYSQVAIVLIVAAIVMLFVMLLTLLAPKQAVAGDIVNFRTARRLASVRLSSDKVTTRASEPIAILICEITAYSPTVAETDSDPLTMASGQKVRTGAVAADLRILPFGSLVRVNGYNNGQPCTVLDTGGMIKGLRLDLFMWSESDARQWGRRKAVPVEILRIGW